MGEGGEGNVPLRMDWWCLVGSLVCFGSVLVTFERYQRGGSVGFVFVEMGDVLADGMCLVMLKQLA